jgi:hypothetical protein
VQAAQRLARGREVALFERQLGAAHEMRRLERLARLVGALQPALAPLEVAHLVGGTRRQQRGDTRRRAALEGSRSLLLGAGIAPLVIGLQRLRERGVGALSPAPRAVGAHIGGQRERVPRQPQPGVEKREQREHCHGEQHHGHLHAPGRVDEHGIACVDASQQHQRDGGGEHRQQPEQRPHPEERSRRDL